MVVMTTEVLRKHALRQLDHANRPGLVVMDEVHYLADRFRGAVWEEAIFTFPSM